ncbi:MAG: hypothetical protein HPY60_08305 [Candidatus Methanofastidiosum sp.]|nr:hypothetical protein [Methanofastidiosum sp.]
MSAKVEKRKYKMEFAGRLIKHLGLQMYSGAVPCIAELIANSYDAMASVVEIEIPFATSIDSEAVITVKDDGHGMSYEECNNSYLVVGRDRRQEEGDYSNKYRGRKKRKLMSRKGIGKLAGFGIANRVEVRTVKDGILNHFAMDYGEMTKGNKFVSDYEPERMEKDGFKVNESNGTIITLSQLKISRPIIEDSFRKSMSRRFTIFSNPEFTIFLNGKKLDKAELEFQFRYPTEKGKWNEEEIKGFGSIKWWVGFTETTIPDEEARGIVIMTRGRLSHTPWFFGISGGVYGQHGMQYLTGEIIADQLDVTEGQDFTSTDRGSILWEEPGPSLLKNWGQNKVKDLLKDWVDKRRIGKENRPEVVKYLEYASRLPPKERHIFNSFVDKLVSIPQLDEDKEILDELIKFGYNALTNHTFLEVIKQINAAEEADRDKIFEILAEWDIIEAVNTAQKIKGRVEIIKKFRQMITDKVPEKPDMQDYIEDHPWLIDMGWESFQREKSLNRILYEKFGQPKTKDKSGREIPDYFCIGDSRTAHVIELKRPGLKIGNEELDQLRDYVFFLRDHCEKEASKAPLKKIQIEGLLIYGDIKDGSMKLRETYTTTNINSWSWDYLLRRAEDTHLNFLDMTTEKVKKSSPDDPRIKQLEEM